MYQSSWGSVDISRFAFDWQTLTASAPSVFNAPARSSTITLTQEAASCLDSLVEPGIILRVPSAVVDLPRGCTSATTLGSLSLCASVEHAEDDTAQIRDGRNR